MFWGCAENNWDLFQTIISLNVCLKPLELQSVLGGLPCIKVSPRLLIKVRVWRVWRIRRVCVPYPGRQSPHVASDVAVPGVATLRPMASQEARGRQRPESSVSEKLPAGHGWHRTSSAGLWICSQAWQLKKRYFYEKSKLHSWAQWKTTPVKVICQLKLFTIIKLICSELA